MTIIVVFTAFLCTGWCTKNVAADCTSVNQTDSNGVTYTLYTNEDMDNGIADLNDTNPLRRTIFIIHGWQQDALKPWVIEMKNAYLNIFYANVITVDWSEYSSSWLYFPSASKVARVGKCVGNILFRMYVHEKITIATTQIVGFSLGAHVAGYAGQEFTQLTGGKKLKTIIGLEAAASSFQNVHINERLDATDAEFVQAFHTSDSGITTRYGTVDVYFNYHLIGCGLIQPGCPENPGTSAPPHSLLPKLFCNHIRAVAYFIESITSKSFLATPCTCAQYKSQACTNQTTVVGENCPVTTTPGEYYVDTASKPPFAVEDEK